MEDWVGFHAGRKCQAVSMHSYFLNYSEPAQFLVIQFVGRPNSVNEAFKQPHVIANLVIWGGFRLLFEYSACISC